MIKNWKSRIARWQEGTIYGSLILAITRDIFHLWMLWGAGRDNVYSVKGPTGKQVKRTSANEKEPNGQIHDEAAGSPSLSDPPHKQCAMNFNVSRDEFVRCLISRTCIALWWNGEMKDFADDPHISTAQLFLWEIQYANQNPRASLCVTKTILFRDIPEFACSAADLSQRHKKK